MPENHDVDTGNRLAVLEQNVDVLVDTVVAHAAELVATRREVHVLRRLLSAVVVSHVRAGSLRIDEVRTLAMQSNHPIEETQSIIDKEIQSMEAMISDVRH